MNMNGTLDLIVAYVDAIIEILKDRLTGIFKIIPLRDATFVPVDYSPSLDKIR